jgi:acetoacetyl-CoA synthetase
MPSMPIRFWNAPDGSLYRDAYFSTFPLVWGQGDWITITERDSVIVHGRPDST